MLKIAVPKTWHVISVDFPTLLAEGMERHTFTKSGEQKEFQTNITIRLFLYCTFYLKNYKESTLRIILFPGRWELYFLKISTTSLISKWIHFSQDYFQAVTRPIQIQSISDLYLWEVYSQRCFLPFFSLLWLGNTGFLSLWSFIPASILSGCQYYICHRLSFASNLNRKTRKLNASSKCV